MSAQELTASRSTSYAADSTLYLYTSLTAGSSHIITATSTLETILHGNRLDFESVDTATDEKARTLWRRRAGGKKLPGLVKYGTVIGNIDDIETWNEQEILVDKIRNVPGRIPLDEKMEIFESSASVEPSSIKASLKDVKINQPAAAPTLTEKLQSKKIHRRLLSDAEFEDLLNAAKAEQPDQATIDALLYESQRRQSLANSGQSTEPSEKITEETIKHSVFHTKESSDSMNELNGNLNMKVGEHEGMEAPTTKKSKYKGVSDEEIARAQIAQAKTIAAASEAAAKKAKEQKHAKLVTAAGRSVASPAEAEPEPEDADIVAAPALAEEKEDTVGQPESVNREKQDQNEEQQGPREGNKADAVSEKHDITPKQPVDIKSPNTVEGPEAKSQKLENAAAPAVADESKNNSAISDNMGAVKSGDVPVLESTSKASLEGSAELERHDDLDSNPTKENEMDIKQTEQHAHEQQHEAIDCSSKDVPAQNPVPAVEPKAPQQPTPNVEKTNTVRGNTNDEQPKCETLVVREAKSPNAKFEAQKQEGPEKRSIATPTAHATPVKSLQAVLEKAVPAVTDIHAEMEIEAQSQAKVLEEKANLSSAGLVSEVPVENALPEQATEDMNEQIQEIPLDELIRSYNIAAEMHDESLANVPDKAAVVVSDLQSEKLEVEPEVKPETTPAEQDVQDAAAPAQKADTQSIIQGKKSVKSDKLPSELFTSSELNLDFNFDLNKSISYDTALKDKELQLPAETQRPSSRSSSQRPHSSQVESISENDKDAGSSGRGFTSRHRHTRTASSKLSAFGLGESRTAKRRNKDLLGDEAESALGVDFEGSRSLSLDVPSQSQRSQSQYSVPTDKEAQRVLPSGEFSAAGAATDYFASDSTVPATTSHIVTPKVIISSNGSSDNGPVAFSEIKDLDLSLNLPATPSLAPRPATSTGISPEVVSSGISILSAEDSSSRKLSKRRQASRSFSVEPARSIKEKSKKMLEGKKNAKKDGKSTCFCM